MRPERVWYLRMAVAGQSGVAVSIGCMTFGLVCFQCIDGCRESGFLQFAAIQLDGCGEFP